MRYVISDIHGCYDEYKKLLTKINFSEQDELYILGDVIDRGQNPIRLLQDIMHHPNIMLILGNHEFMMYTIMKRMAVDITHENFDKHLTLNDLLDYNLWLQNGGQTTVEQFRKLDKLERMDLLEYLAESPLYEVIQYHEKQYVLVHAGLGNFDPEKDLGEYELDELLSERMDYSKRYYPDKNTFVITGHTPTIYIPGWEKPEVYQQNGHIAIDCGCAAGGRLAAYCIETEQVTYVDKM